MSSGDNGSPAAPARLGDLGAKFLIPVAAALTLLSFVRGAARRIDHELQLCAPGHVAQGALLPVRALLYTDLHRPEGARLRAARTTLELRASSDQALLAASVLHFSFGQSLDAVLSPPVAFTGKARLVATSDEPRVKVERDLEIGAVSAASRQAREPRRLPPLQRMAPGPVRVSSSDERAPSSLSLAIAGGVCVPEQPCQLFLHVGEPAAAVSLVPTPSVSLEPGDALVSGETSAVVRLRVRTHGPEAELRIAALRGGVQVATRAYRLAVALGASAARELPAILDAPARPSIGLFGDEPGCIVDAFASDRWARTGALRECRGGDVAPFAALEPGLWRLQLRRDPFAADSAAVRGLYVRRPGQSADEILRELANAVLEHAPDDPLAKAVRADPAPYEREIELVAHHLLARLDEGILTLPAMASSYPADLARLSAEQAVLRNWALLAIGLCALALGLLVAQRGLRAASQASELMAAAGEDARGLDRQRLRMVLRVLATVTSLLLAFAAIAVYMVARSHGIW
ncbi:MAG: hypothetical protein ACHQ53_13075 [Polyangiales bacterium]